MGAYLSQPNTVKTTADGGNTSLSYGFAAMQGWRVSMELVRTLARARIHSSRCHGLESGVTSLADRSTGAQLVTRVVLRQWWLARLSAALTLLWSAGYLRARSAVDVGVPLLSLELDLQPWTEARRWTRRRSCLQNAFSPYMWSRGIVFDAHNCIPDLDEETAMFAVYDGHGGEEVALYCSKYLPEIIMEQKTYKDGKLQKALEDAFLAIDSRMTMDEVVKELAQIAGRPQEDEVKERVADEDDVDNEEAALLHEEATMTIEELLIRYGQNLNSIKNAKKPCHPTKKAAGPEDGEDACPDKDVNGEAGGTNSEPGGKNGKPKPAAGKSSGSDARGSRSSGDGGSGSCPADKPQAEGEAASPTGDAGPSCSSSAAQPQWSSKSKFFEDSDESEEAEDEEEEDSEEEVHEIFSLLKDGSEEDEGEYSSTEEDEEEEDSDAEDEEMCLPGMDGKEEPGSDSGTTAVVALIRGKQLIVANAGDSRCVVSEKGKAVDMSYDHKPEDEVELARIKNAGGKVTMDGRVNGGLNLSRAIGDHFYKRNKALPPEEQMISALPDIKVLTLNKDHDFMVIACDGIWNVMSSQEVIDFVSERIKPNENGEVRLLSSIVEELLDHCLAPDTSGDGTGCDNMTCVIVTFTPQPSSSPAEGSTKRKAEESAAEKNGNDSKKSKTE
ncbi:PPM1G phosphatase, partial [Atractosteus spatula]|nr:PPM1G phosphatase [Atractosteus spatula]